MTQPFLALITPLSDARPDNSLPGPQPGGGLGIWGGPWQPPYPSQGPGFPSQLPMPGGPPWGGVGQPYPDQGLPGGPVRPANSLPGSGLGTWGPNDPRPTPPIYVPPQAPITDPDDPQKAYLVAYMPAYGGGYERITFSVVIASPTKTTEPSPKPSQG